MMIGVILLLTVSEAGEQNQQHRGNWSHCDVARHRHLSVCLSIRSSVCLTGTRRLSMFTIQYCNRSI